MFVVFTDDQNTRYFTTLEHEAECVAEIKKDFGDVTIFTDEEQFSDAYFRFLAEPTASTHPFAREEFGSNTFALFMSKHEDGSTNFNTCERETKAAVKVA